MFCYRCGQQIPDDSAFCRVCGTRLTQPEPVEAPPQAPVMDAALRNYLEQLHTAQNVIDQVSECAQAAEDAEVAAAACHLRLERKKKTKLPKFVYFVMWGLVLLSLILTLVSIGWTDFVHLGDPLPIYFFIAFFFLLLCTVITYIILGIVSLQISTLKGRCKKLEAISVQKREFYQDFFTPEMESQLTAALSLMSPACADARYAKLFVEAVENGQATSQEEAAAYVEDLCHRDAITNLAKARLFK